MKKTLLLNYFKAATSRNPRKNTTRFNGLLALFVMGMGMGVSWGQTTIISNVTGGGNLPTNWTSINGNTTDVIDKTSYYLLETTTLGLDQITTGNYDLSAYSYIKLNVDITSFGSGAHNALKVEVSSASGSTFTALGTSYLTAITTTSNVTQNLVISAPPGGFSTTTKFRFSNNASSGRGIRITNINASAPTQASNVTFSSVSTSGFILNWTDGSNNSSGRRAVFVAATSSGSAVPINGITYTANTTFGSGTQIGSTGWYCVYNNTGTHASGVSITGLANGTTYRVMVCENEGTGATSVYNTISASNNPNNQATTSASSNSTASDIITQSGYSYTSNIDYASKQTASTLTIANSVGVNGLTLRDGGATTDTDALGTTLTDVTFSTGGSTAIRTAALFDGMNKIAEVAVNGATSIVFTGLSLSATDGGTKDFELRVTYQSTVTDNQQITFTVSSATASASTSNFATANAGAAASSVTGDDNRLEVTASALAFVAQPVNTLVSAGMTNVTVSANDALANRDLDFTSSVRITSTGTLTGTPVDVSASSGLATFNSLTHTVLGSSLTMKAERTSGLDWDVTSGTFDITVQAPGLLLFEDNFTHSTILTSNGYNATSGTGTNNLTAGENGLTYTNYGSSNIGNALSVANTGQDDSITFTQQNSATTVYASFLVKVTAAQSGDYFFAFTPSTSNTTYRARTFIKASVNSGFINFGISNSGTVNYNSTPTDYPINTTHLVVVKYTFTSATSATASIFINPNTTSEPSNSEVSFTDNIGANAPADINSFSIRQGTAANAPTLVMDGIRIATNWGALMGNPHYSDISTIAAGNYNSITTYTGSTTSISGDVNVYGQLSILGGTLATNNTLTLKSNANGTASVGNSAGTISGNVTVERYIPNKRAWRALTAPLKGSDTSIFSQWQNNGTISSGIGVELWGPGGTGSSGNGLAVGPSSSILQYVSGAWSPVENTKTSNLFTTSGNNAFMIFPTGGYGSGNIASSSTATATTLRATGQLIMGDVPFTGLSSTHHTLIGNPYASPINLNSILDANATLEKLFWVWDPNGANQGAYNMFDADANSYTVTNLSYTNSTVIQSGQAFFVKALSGQTGSFTISESNKSTSSTNNVFRNNNPAELLRVGLYKQENNEWSGRDGAMTVILPDANANQSPNKMANGTENVAFVKNGSLFASEHHLPLVASDVLNVRVWRTTAGANYKLKINTEQFTSTNLNATLEDLFTNSRTPLNLEGTAVEYPFTVTTDALSTGDRFRIVFQNAVLGTNNPTATSFSIVPNPVIGDSFQVNLGTLATGKYSYSICNAIGQEVEKGTINNVTQNTNYEVKMSNSATGIYIMKIKGNDNTVFTAKIIKK